MDHLKVDELDVFIFPTESEMGAAAADAFSEAVNQDLDRRNEVGVVLAAQAKSQQSFITNIREREDLDWSRLHVFQVDEYPGITGEHPASGRYRNYEYLIDHVNAKAFHGIRGEHQPLEEELERYTQLLEDVDPSVSVIGVGVTGHLAFNDPPADFDTTDTMALVPLLETSREGILGIGRFKSMDEVPTHGITITIPGLLRPETLMAVVPERSKAPAIRAMLEEPVSPDCPASIMRTKPGARLYLTEEAASLVTLPRDKP